MAGDWIKVEVCTPDKPEMGIIAEFTEMTPEEAFGRVFKVWAWWDQHAETGNAIRVTTAFLDRIAGKPGFAEAMRFAGWLEQRDGGFVLPLFERHNGITGKTRALSAKRQAKFKRKGNGVDHDEVTEPSLPRGEERREEVPTTANAVVVPKAAIPECPHQEIIALYHQALPSGRQVSDWNASRSAALKARWREKKGRQSLDWWKRFFEHIGKSDFLMGRKHAPNRDPFEISLPWILESENFLEIIEGKYNR